MVGEEAEGIPRQRPEDSALEDHIGHWVDVLDRWVKELDRAMGRNGTDGTSEPAVEDTGAGADS